MTIPRLEPFGHWLGQWQGLTDETEAPPLMMRVTLERALHGEILLLGLEATNPQTGALVLAARGVLGESPQGVLRLGMWSSLSGNYVLELSPDDPDVLALHGRTARGSLITMSLLSPAAGQLQVNFVWRADDPVAGHAGRLTAVLTLARPWAGPA